MSIPFLKGWGSSIKDAAEEVTPALKSLVNQNWQQHEALKKELLNPVTLKTYANHYWDDKDAFNEKDIGRDNLARIRATTQDPAFMAKKIKDKAALTWMQDPDNQAELQRIATGAEPPEVKQMRAMQFKEAKVKEAEANARVELFNTLPKHLQERARRDATFRERFGMTEPELAAADQAMTERNRLMGSLDTARKWAEGNADVLSTPYKIRDAIKSGKIPAATLGMLMLDDQYKGLIAAGQKLWMDEVNYEQQATLQERGINAAADRQATDIAARDERATAVQAQKVYGLEARLASLVGAMERDRQAGKVTRSQVENSIIPSIQAVANEIASIKGTTPAIIRIEDNGFWGTKGKGKVTYTIGGDPVELNETSLGGLVSGAPKPSDDAGAPKTDAKFDALPKMTRDYLDMYKSLSLPEQNKAWESASPALRAILEDAKKNKWIDSLDQPE